MDHSDQMQQQQQQPAMGVLAGNGHMPYPNPSYQPPSMVATGTPAVSTTFPPQQHPAFNQPQQFYSPQQQEQLQAFWANQMQEIEQTSEFKNHSLPLARIKKIMKADEDVRMISSEAPVIFSKACEMFILELTLRSWIHTEENKRRTLQKNDIAAAISKTEVFDFLVDIIPRDELKEEGLGITKAFGSPPETLPYYYAPPQYPVGHQAALYAGQRAQPVPPPFVTWTQSQTQPPSEQQQQQPE